MHFVKVLANYIKYVPNIVEGWYGIVGKLRDAIRKINKDQLCEKAMR